MAPGSGNNFAEIRPGSGEQQRVIAFGLEAGFSRVSSATSAVFTTHMHRCIPGAQHVLSKHSAGEAREHRDGDARRHQGQRSMASSPSHEETTLSDAHFSAGRRNIQAQALTDADRNDVGSSCTRGTFAIIAGARPDV